MNGFLIQSIYWLYVSRSSDHGAIVCYNSVPFSQKMP